MTEENKEPVEKSAEPAVKAKPDFLTILLVTVAILIGSYYIMHSKGLCPCSGSNSCATSPGSPCPCDGGPCAIPQN